MIDQDTRNLKQICALLHNIKQTNQAYFLGIYDIDGLIDTAEKVYHERKGAQQ